jgi:DNA-binding MarR family transcriptional regulator
MNKKPHISLGRMLGMTMKSVKETMETNLKEADIDISIDQFVILKILDTMEDVNQQICANLLRMDKSLFLRKLDVMQERKLVARIPDKNDKRRNQLVLTKQGLQKYAECEKVEQKTVKQLMNGVSNEEFTVFAKVLDIIRNNSTEKPIS